MATVFDTTTYPLSSETTFSLQPRVERDTMDSGAPRVRVLGGDYGEVGLVFAPMDSSTAESFESYISDNIATEFDITYRNITYRGYLWSDLESNESEGNLTVFTITFRGQAVFGGS